MEIFKEKVCLKIIPNRNVISTIDGTERLPINSDLLSLKKYGEDSILSYIRTGFKVLPKKVSFYLLL